MRLLFVTLVVTALAGFFPLVNAEVYLAAVATQVPPGEVWPLALAAGMGQALGKLPWYWASANSMRIPYVQRKMVEGKFATRFETWRNRVEGRPLACAGVMMLASVVSVPPLLVMGTVAGALRMNLWIFLTTIAIGRALQSYVILLGLATVFRL